MAGTTELLMLGIALFAAGGIAGVTAGLFGVGGGFIVVPALLAVFPFTCDHYRFVRSLRSGAQ